MSERAIFANRSLVPVASGINVVAGIWLIAAPWVLNFTEQGRWNSVVIGAAIALLAALRATGTVEAAWPSWINLVLGAWLVVAPFILTGYEATETLWNSVIVGLIVAVLAVTSALSARDSVS